MDGQLGFGNLPVYSGSRYQAGGGLLSSLKNVIIPIAKKFGKSALSTAVEQLPQLASSVLSGNNASEALKAAGRQVVSSVGSKAAKQFAEVFNEGHEPTILNTAAGARKRPAAPAAKTRAIATKKRRRATPQKKDIFSKY